MNPNNCAMCDHKKRPDGGHCYMFRDEPTDVCMRHTGRFKPANAIAQGREHSEEAERMAEQAFFLKAAQAESERYCEQRDNLLRVLRHITCEPINAEYMAQEAIDAIVADEINEANGGAVCRF